MYSELQIIEKVRIECQQNSVARDLVTLFRDTKRTEDVVDLRRLKARLASLGTPMDEKLWLRAVKLLEDAGIGTLELQEGRPVRLKDVKYTLRSLGDAVFKQRDTLEHPRFGQGARRVVLSGRVYNKRQIADRRAAVRSGRNVLRMDPSGSITVELPGDLTTRDLVSLLDQFRASQLASNKQQ